MQTRTKMAPYLAIAPAVLLVVGIMIYPIAFALIHSFTVWDGVTARFDGLRNYVFLFRDANLARVFLNTLVFLISVPLIVMVGLMVAVLVYEKVVGWRFFRALFFVPSVLSTVVIGLIFNAFFAYDGPVNDLLKSVGIRPVDWMGNGWSAMIVIILALVWSSFGYGMMIFLAALSSIDPAIYEAATIDGAKWWTRLFRLTLPLLKGPVQFLSVSNVIFTFTSMFGFIFVMTGGGPGFDTTTIDYYIYLKAFSGSDMGGGSALAFILFLIVVSSRFYKFVCFDNRKPEEVQRVKGSFSRVVIFIVLVLIALSAVYPLIFMLINTFKSNSAYLVNVYGLPHRWTLENIQSLISNYDVFGGLWHSLFVTIVSVIVVVLISALAAQAFAKYEFAGRQPIFYLLISFMLVPGPVLLIPVYVMFARMGLINNFLSAILVYISLNLPFGIYLLTTNFRSIPNEIMESARIDGAGYWRTFRSVVLPVGQAAVVTLATLTFLAVWNELLMSMMLLSSNGTKMLTPSIASIAGRFTTDMPVMLAGLLFSALPTIIVYVFLSRYLIRGMMLGSIR